MLKDCPSFQNEGFLFGERQTLLKEVSKRLGPVVAVDGISLSIWMEGFSPSWALGMWQDHDLAPHYRS